jgi:DNA glycosylase AlkZ-like
MDDELAPRRSVRRHSMATDASRDGTVADERLRRQLLTHTGLRRPPDVVEWLGAMQAQEYAAAVWAIALRMRDGAVAADIERAFDNGHILRTHVMRPTWHFVTPADIRWLLELTAPRVHRRMAPYNRQLELDTRTLTRALGVIERALRDGHFLTRAELGERLQRAGLLLTAMQLAHVAMHAELERVVCSGPRRGKRFTYALLAERAPTASRMPREEALGALGHRFLRSHGPATIRDFVWWSGLATPDVRRALDIIKARAEDIGGQTYWTCDWEPRGPTRHQLAHLLPVYDEYIVAYRDRIAVPHGPPKASRRRWTTFEHMMTIAGQVVGTWRPARTAKGVRIDVAPFRRLAGPERDALTRAAHRYEQFLGTPVKVSIA